MEHQQSMRRCDHQQSMRRFDHQQSMRRCDHQQSMRRSAAETESVCEGPAGSSGMNTGSLPSVVSIDPELHKCLSEVNTLLAIHVATWMKKRGKSLRPKLSDEQRKQLEECFGLMDADGSGAIDAEELGAAFKLLGLDVTKAEIASMLAEVDEDGSGEVEYPEFIEIMTSTLSKLEKKKEEEGTGGSQVPFALVATAYRRKRIMEGLISGDKDVIAQVISIAEQTTRQAAEEAERQQQQQVKLQQLQGRLTHASSVPSAAVSPKGGRDSSKANMYKSNSNSRRGTRGHLQYSASSLRVRDSDTTGAAAAAAGAARAAEVTSQAGVSSGLMRALNHVKSFCSSLSSSALTSPSSSTAGSQRSSLDVPVAPRLPLSASHVAAGTAAATAAAASSVPMSGTSAAGSGIGGDGGCAAATPSGACCSQEMLQQLDESGAFRLPVEGVAGVLDVEEQQQLVGLLRAKTRKRLEALAAAAAAAGQPGASSTGARWPTLPGGPHSLSASTTDGSRTAGTVGSSTAGTLPWAGAPLQPSVSGEVLVGARQRLTSQLQLKQLTEAVEPLHFSLTSPVMRSAAGSLCSSPGPPAGRRTPRSFKSTSSSPVGLKQQPPIATRSAASNISTMMPVQQHTEQALPSAAVCQHDSSSALKAFSSVAAIAASGSVPCLSRGMNFNDTKIYEYSDTWSGSTTGHAIQAGRFSSSPGWCSDASGQGSSILVPIHRSKSLGHLLMDRSGELGSPPSSAHYNTVTGAASSSPLDLRARGSAGAHGASAKKAVSNDTSCDGSASDAGQKSSVHSRVTAAALQQLGTGPALSTNLQAAQQQQQPWLGVPQLPRMGRSLQQSPSQQRSNSRLPSFSASIALLHSKNSSTGTVYSRLDASLWTTPEGAHLKGATTVAAAARSASSSCALPGNQHIPRRLL